MLKLADAIEFQTRFQDSPIHVQQGNRKGFLLDNISKLINVSEEAREKLTRLLQMHAWR